MKKVIFIAGLPGVGKSTFAKNIAKKINGVILDIDEIKKQIVNPELVSSTIDPPEVRWRCYEKAAEQIADLFKQGVQTVVVDEVFHLQSLRQNLEDICVNNGALVSWIEVRCPTDAIVNRLHENGGRDGHILTTDETLKMNKLFGPIFEQFPEDKLNYTTFVNDGSLDMKDFNV
ncbi:AAA family ATPase [Candidatus Falkowbacteria bacterium]|nr:AAA family ATPase [Candidatus Falkowbacteria bacterium]